MAEFLTDCYGLEHSESFDEVYLYHGTSCWRRWEITSSGHIKPGRSGLSFFSSRPSDAFTYARAACHRDSKPHSCNSLVCEPVVLKVKFNSKSWHQIDYIQKTAGGQNQDIYAFPHFSLGAIDEIAAESIVEVLHCNHGRKLAVSVTDKAFQEGIRHLRAQANKLRLEALLMRLICNFYLFLKERITGKSIPTPTFKDELYRLIKAQV